ncbi:hypothetical protein OIV19_20400 [Brucella sp. HL-2]|nr:hypothetical protein [Brucella sp. HL-2]MCV9909963.1 hypothetical protein [Brucella sp. HL-2]
MQTLDQKEAFLRSWFDVPENVHWAHGMSNEVEKEISESFDRAIAAWNTRPAEPVKGELTIPRSPTEAMMNAGLYHCSHDMEWSDLYTAWQAMFDAVILDGGLTEKAKATAAPVEGLETVLWAKTDVNGRTADTTDSNAIADVWKEQGLILREYIIRPASTALDTFCWIKEDGSMWFNKPEGASKALYLQSQAEAIIAAERAEKEQAIKELKQLVVSFVHEHFPENKVFNPFDDLLGLISQIDNACTVARTYVDKIATLEADNAALTARVKELIFKGRLVLDVLNAWEDDCDLVNSRKFISDFRAALEAKP